MPSPTIDEACIALATVVGSITGLRAKAYIDDQINPDEAQVYTRPYDPRQVFGKGTSYGPTLYQLGVRIYTSRENPRSAQKRMRGYLESTGATSVLAVIEDETSWAETISYAEVTNIGQPFVFVLPAGDGSQAYWAVDIDVDVNW